MKLAHKITFFLFLLTSTVMLAQTPGFSYQALILNNEIIQIPGADVKQREVPLASEDILLRFSITNDAGIEYMEEHAVTTEENGMVSVIVGTGRATIGVFENIFWDGKEKDLSVELNIISSNEGFVFLDSQKILSLPGASVANTPVVKTLSDITMPSRIGDFILVDEYGINKKPTLLIWDGTEWKPAISDYDETNELGLVVATDEANRDALFPIPKKGDQVWNETCGCIEVFNGAVGWVPSATNAEYLNGLTKVDDIIKLGGDLTEPTEIITGTTNTFAIKNLEETTTTSLEHKIVVVEDSGVLKTINVPTPLQQVQTVITATDGQVLFGTPEEITTNGKINVYRNGIRVNFTTINTNTIEIEPDATCFQNDQIRIVQLY